MQFEHKVGSLGHELGRAVDIEALRAQAGIELAQDVVAVFGAVASDDFPLGFVLVGFAGTAFSIQCDPGGRTQTFP